MTTTSNGLTVPPGGATPPTTSPGGETPHDPATEGYPPEHYAQPKKKAPECKGFCAFLRGASKFTMGTICAVVAAEATKNPIAVQGAYEACSEATGQAFDGAWENGAYNNPAPAPAPTPSPGYKGF